MSILKKNDNMLPIWLSGLAALGLFAGMAWYLAPLEPGLVALQFAFAPKVFGEIIHFWSEEQLLRFRMHFVADFAFLLAYGLFGYLLATRTRVFHSLPSPLRRLAAWMLPAAALFDATENVLHLWLTEMPRFGVQLPYLAAATCAAIKWLLLLAFTLVLLAAIARSKD